jgi:very-short-patch-repair endonuclease
MKRGSFLDTMAADTAPRTLASMCDITSRRSVASALSRGALTRLVPDQYCLTLHADSWLMRSRAAVEWAGPGAALTGLAALAAYRYAPEPVDVIQVAVPAGGHRSGPPWISVRSLTMPFATGTWVPRTQLTSPALALVLGYGRVPPHRRAKFLHGAIRAGVVDAKELDRLAQGLTRIPAKRELRDRLKLIAAGAESYLEERGMTTVFTGSAFSEIVFQHRIRVRGEGFRIDAFHPPTLTAFELDGKDTHGELPDRERDVRRDALLATVGIQTVRFTSEAVFKHPEWCRELASEVIESRQKVTWAA